MKKFGLESLFNKAAGLQTCKIIKKILQHRCFPVNIEKFLRAPILRNIYERLLLKRLPLKKLFSKIPAD